MEEGCCVSAPGKVLVAGGYLVTLRPHPGLVFSVSARLYAAVQPIAPLPETEHHRQHEFELVVDSPQFRKTFRFSAALTSTSTGSSEPYLLLRNLYTHFTYYLFIQ
jgi:phosphomevalonate kinase